MTDPAVTAQTRRYRWTLDLPGIIAGPVAGSTFLAAQDSSPLGAGWTWSMLDRLYLIPDGGPGYPEGLLRVFGTGGWRFYPGPPDAGGAYTSPANDPGTLNRTTEGGGTVYYYTNPDGERWRFRSDGQQDRWISADTYEVTTYGYDGAGRLATFSPRTAARRCSATTATAWCRPSPPRATASPRWPTPMP